MTMRGPITPNYNSLLEKAWKTSSLTIGDTIQENKKVQAIIQYMKFNRRYSDFFANGTMHRDYQKYILKSVYENELNQLEQSSSVPSTWDIFSVIVTNELRYLSPHLSPTQKTKAVMNAVAKSEHFGARTPDEKITLQNYIIATCYRDSINDLQHGLSINQSFVDAVVEANRACFSAARAKL